MRVRTGRFEKLRSEESWDSQAVEVGDGHHPVQAHAAVTPAHLVDHVIPDVPLRHCVLSQPIPLPTLLAGQPVLVTQVLQVVQRGACAICWLRPGSRRTKATAAASLSNCIRLSDSAGARTVRLRAGRGARRAASRRQVAGEAGDRCQRRKLAVGDPLAEPGADAPARAVARQPQRWPGADDAGNAGDADEVQATLEVPAYNDIMDTQV